MYEYYTHDFVSIHSSDIHCISVDDSDILVFLQIYICSAATTSKFKSCRVSRIFIQYLVHQEYIFLSDKKQKKDQWPGLLHSPNYPLDHQPLNLVLDRTNLAGEVTCFVGGDAGSDHRARDTGSPTKSELKKKEIR